MGQNFENILKTKEVEKWLLMRSSAKQVVIPAEPWNFMIMKFQAKSNTPNNYVQQ